MPLTQKFEFSTLIKIVVVIFLAGTTWAGVRQELADKVDRDSFVAETTYTRAVDRDIMRVLQEVNVNLSEANGRLRELCIATRAGCR